eukprot:SAG31_NODE_1511_length_8060_cov_3.005653_6_plen_101_part_00
MGRPTCRDFWHVRELPATTGYKSFSMETWQALWLPDCEVAICGCKTPVRLLSERIWRWADEKMCLYVKFGTLPKPSCHAAAVCLQPRKRQARTEYGAKAI